MGCFTILTAIPGFFLSALVLMLLWGVIAPNFGIEKISHGYADNDHPLACRGTAGSSWAKSGKITFG